MFRQLRHLLPQGEAWKTAIERQFTKLLRGLSGAPDDAREFIDDVFEDLHPETTREIEEWEHEFGLPPGANEATSRANIAAAHAATGGQSPAYIQGILQAAGFDVYVHEPWVSTEPYVARDPRLYAGTIYYGTVRFAIAPFQHQFTERINPFTFETNSQPQFNALSSGANYYDNKTLQQRMLPPIPDDPDQWPFFVYIGGETFPTKAYVDPDRKSELDRLILQLRPLTHWVMFLTQDTEPPEENDDFLFAEGNGWGESYWPG